MIRHLLTIVAASSLAAPMAYAQSSLPGAGAIAAAHHAVEATDAHTAAMTAPSYSAPSAPVRVASAAQKHTPVATKTAAGTPTAAAPATTAATTAPTTAARPARADSTPMPKTGKSVMSFSRETYSYAGGGRRDPFKSLLAVGGELRPVLSDLRLVTIVFAANGQNSVAILRDLTTKEQYRVRVGQTLGRMRVAAIDPRQVTFTIEEFGYSRQETLMYNDPTTTRSK